MHNSFIQLTICVIHYNPRHVSSINKPIFRRTNCNITASGIVTLCKRLYSMLDESNLLSSGILYSCLVTIPDAVIIQFVLLKMGMLMLETCRGLYSMPDESNLLSSGIIYCRLQRMTIPDAVIIQFVLLKMGTLMLETCRGL